MKILAIETSCDETAIALVEVQISNTNIKAETITSQLFSQIDIHKEFGGVFPSVAKREHAKHAPLLLEKILKEISHEHSTEETKKISIESKNTTHNKWTEIENMMEREPGMFEKTKEVLEKFARPDIDMLAVTCGPGLEPALWVGINFAKALSLYWDIPLIPTNHMKGHIFSVLLNRQNIEFPALALLISGGHTELVEMSSTTDFTIIGKTRDDAVGESYDKVARLLGFEYPGGPTIAKLAQQARSENLEHTISLPRPMLNSPDLDFSFSGLKTAVLYKVRDYMQHDTTLNTEISEDIKLAISQEFEQAVTDVLLKKLKKALDMKNYKTLIISGGVIANTYIREQISQLAKKENIPLLFPSPGDSTDNAQMIAIAGALEAQTRPPNINPQIRACGNLEY